MEQQPSSPSEERRSGMELPPAGQEQREPKSRDIYVSLWMLRETDEQSRRQVHPILLSALFGLAAAAAIVLIVALALMWSDLAGFLLAVAMFAIIRHAQFRRVRSALVHGKRT